METFITKIYVNKSRGGVRDLEIPLSETQRQHLIITGKNGSGKTGVLEEIKKFLSQIEIGMYANVPQINEQIAYLKNQLQYETNIKRKSQYENNIKDYQNILQQFGNLDISFSENAKEITENFQKGNILLVYFDAKRFVKLNTPKGINKVNLKSRYGLMETVNENFIQYIVNMKADKSFAKDDNEIDAVKKIDEWFEHFENQLKEIFDEPSLKLVFDRKNYNFTIKINEQEFGFTTLSDGYSAIISIITELLLRMESYIEYDKSVSVWDDSFDNSFGPEIKAYDMEGIVLIDEIETHLHVELQKRVLPFLIAFFPKIQFIVTTHSPFVLSSVANATICDLQNRIVAKDFSAYSSENLVENYFMIDKYSDEVKRKVAEYEILMLNKNKSKENEERIKELKNYFADVPKYKNEELLVKLQQIELNALK